MKALKKAAACVLAAAVMSCSTTAFAEVKGDMDGDGTLTSSDALVILRCSVDIETLTRDGRALADIDGDGVITSSDALSVLKSSTDAEQAKPKERQFAEETVRLVNIERAKEGLDPLVLDETLYDIAMIRSGELTRKMSHERPNGEYVFPLITEMGVNARAMGENIAGGQATPEDAVRDWMNSPSHRESILDPRFKRTGVGVAFTDSEYRYYWAQVFTD